MNRNGKRLAFGTMITAALLTAVLVYAQPPVTGSYKLAWDQAATTAELGELTWAIFVDGNRAPLAGVACSAAGIPNSSICLVNFPAMTPGTHAIEVIAIRTTGGAAFESAHSAPLAVRFMVVATPTGLRIIAPGQGAL